MNFLRFLSTLYLEATFFQEMPYLSHRTISILGHRILSYSKNRMIFIHRKCFAKVELVDSVYEMKTETQRERTGVDSEGSDSK